MSLLENSGFGQICNAKAKGRSNEGEECYFIEKKVDVGRGCSEPKSSGEKWEFRVGTVSAWVAGVVSPCRRCWHVFPCEIEIESHSVVWPRPHGLYRMENSKELQFGTNMQYRGQNTGVGSLSRLQGIFPTQESNRGLLHCRRILYQLSYQGSPWIKVSKYKNDF